MRPLLRLKLIYHVAPLSFKALPTWTGWRGRSLYKDHLGQEPYALVSYLLAKLYCTVYVTSSRLLIWINTLWSFGISVFGYDGWYWAWAGSSEEPYIQLFCKIPFFFRVFKAICTPVHLQFIFCTYIDIVSHFVFS